LEGCRAAFQGLKMTRFARDEWMSPSGTDGFAGGVEEWMEDDAGMLGCGDE